MGSIGFIKINKLFKSKKGFGLIFMIILIGLGILLNPTLTIIIIIIWLLFAGYRKYGLQKKYMNIMEGIKSKITKFK